MTRLAAIKLVHTVVWAIFVACILGVFVAAYAGRLGLAAVLIGVVMGEVLVLALNQLKCPLTGVAARYTEDRAPNFDIYLPRWLAEHNKEVFGTLYLLGIGYTLVRWMQ
ncbi:MAG: hypothetical protein KJZ47_01620 [Gemmatimonadales bacterium]|nr:hypothetical protein [Gemmatimonadales bacterium]